VSKFSPLKVRPFRCVILKHPCLQVAFQHLFNTLPDWSSWLSLHSPYSYCQVGHPSDPHSALPHLAVPLFWQSPPRSGLQSTPLNPRVGPLSGSTIHSTRLVGGSPKLTLASPRCGVGVIFSRLATRLRPKRYEPNFRTPQPHFGGRFDPNRL
jgi:hypothetical protein